MRSEVDRWHALAASLGVEVIAPASLVLGETRVTFAALLPHFGGKNGMIAHPDFDAISPHREQLTKLGYGYSAVSIGDEDDDVSAQELLRDWGWTASEAPPHWL